MSTINWAERQAEIIAAEDNWESLKDLYDMDWVSAHYKEFIAYSMSRGWLQEDAESWLDNIEHDSYNLDPVEQARQDVEAIEQEWNEE